MRHKPALSCLPQLLYEVIDCTKIWNSGLDRELNLTHEFEVYLVNLETSYYMCAEGFLQISQGPFNNKNVKLVAKFSFKITYLGIDTTFDPT